MDYLDKDKFYKVLETNKKKPILLFELADIKEWKIVNDTLLIVSKDSLYVYSDNKGLSKIITYNELNYNYKNIYNIWKKSCKKNKRRKNINISSDVL